jgi:hypothetical protein
MTSIIKADDGVISGVTGITSTADNSGTLELQAISGLVNMNNVTGGMWLPNGTTAQRPASPQNGQMRYNTTTALFEAYQGGVWINFVNASPPSVNYLVVAGGGGAGASQTSDPSAGGGAGGYRAGTLAVTAGAITTVTVGAGGTGGSFANVQSSGANSVFDTITSLGGGGGGNGSGGGQASTTYNGLSGGSGGGGGYHNSALGTGGAGTSGQGNNGANGQSVTGGGGGGSSAVGSGQIGGAGTSSSISGSAVTYAAGGNGSINSSGAGSAGTTNRGNGGNAGWNTAPGPNGGSGIVIISYSSVYKLATATGTYAQTSSGGNYIFTFTGSGTITF